MTGIALIGCGKWGSNYLDTLQTIIRGKLLYVCDLNEEIRNKIAVSYPETKVVDHYQTILNDPQVQGVIIATPPDTHYSLAVDCLNSDKSVLVEKPVTESYITAQKLVDLADQRGQVLMVGHLMQYHPAVQLIKKHFDQGNIGRLRFLDFTRTNCQIYRKDVNVLADLAVHDLSILLFILEEPPLWVQAVGVKWQEEIPLGSVVITAAFPGGALAHIHANWHYSVKQRRISVIGTKGLMEFDDCVKKDSPAVTIINAKGEKDYIATDRTKPLYQQCMHFIDCINNGHRSLSNAKNALKVMKFLDAVERSLTTQKKCIVKDRNDEDHLF